MTDEHNHAALDMADVERCLEPDCKACGDRACSHRTLEVVSGPHAGFTFHCIVLINGRACDCKGYSEA